MMAIFTLVALGAIAAVAVWLWWVGAWEGGVDRFRDAAARLYPTRPLPRRSVPRKLLRAAERTLSVGVSGTVLVPTRIEISVHPDDLEAFTGALGWLGRDIGDALRAQAETKGWTVPSGPEVEVVADPDRPLRMPRAFGYIDALEPEVLRTIESGRPPAGSSGPTVALPGKGAAPSGAALHVRLVAIGGAVAGAQTADPEDLSGVLVPGQTLILGRSRDADLRVRDRNVSSRHCAFRLDSETRHLVVEDLGSTNGTFLGDRRLGTAVVSHGATLRAGGVLWRVEIDHVGPR